MEDLRNIVQHRDDHVTGGSNKSRKKRNPPTDPNAGPGFLVVDGKLQNMGAYGVSVDVRPLLAKLAALAKIL